MSWGARRVNALLFALACGCGAARGTGSSTAPSRVGARRGGDGASASPGSSQCAGSVPPSTQLVQRFDAMAQSLGTEGIRFNGIVSAGFITHGSNVTTAIDVPAGTCMSIIAIASPSIHDIDAHLFSPDGEILVEDVEEDPHPTVQLCATEPRRVYHVIETYVTDQNPTEGRGAYAVATFSSDRHGLETVAHVIGGRPGTAVTTSANGTDAERRLAELREGIARRGFSLNAEVIRAQFAAAGAVRFPVAVSADKCYTLAALAEGSLTDTDLSVFDSDGEEIARDIRPDRDAFVQLCPPAMQTLSVEVRARPGPGWVLLQSFAADAAAVGGANTLWLGERLAWGASAAPLTEALEAARAAMASQGFTAAGTPTSVTFAPGESREQRVTLEPGRCTAVAAVLGRGLGRTELRLQNVAGDLLARGVTHGPGTLAVVCPPAREEVVVRMRAAVGSGEAAVVTYPGGAIPAWATGVDRVAVSESFATAIATNQGGWHSEGTPDRLRLGARAVRSREFDLAPGTCTRFAVSAGAGLPEIALTMRASTGQPVAQSSADGTAVLTRCVAGAEHVRVEAAIEPAGPAEYDAFLTRYTRPDRAAGH